METREHDIFMDMTANPNMSLNELVAIGVNANNTALEDKSVYESNDWVKDKYKNEYGEFDQMKFDSAYQNAKIAYNMLSQIDYNKAVDNVVSYHRDNIFVPTDKRRSEPDYYEYFTSNPYKTTSSVSQLGKVSQSPLSIDEIAQANKVLLNPTTAGDNFENAEWGGSPNDNFFKYFTNTLVLAQYDEEGTHQDPITGEIQHHEKGDLKLDDEGNFYYEDLDGREVYGRQVLNKMNVLTTDGSFWNKFDPFDSDDIQQKSIAGTLIKNLALVGTMFLPGIGPWIAGISVATQVVGLLGTMAKMTGSVDPMWNELEGWSKSVNRQTAKTQYAQEHTWCWENFINLFGDVVGQLKEQRFIFEKVPMVFTGGKDMSTVAGQVAKLKEYEKAEEALINTKFGKLSSLPDPDKQLARVIEAQQRIHTRASYNLDSFVKGYNNLGAVISKGYMTAITVGDTFGEAKLQGASDMDATLLTLGYAVGEYAILSTGLGEWVLPELRAGKYKNQAIAKALTNLRKDSESIHKQIGGDLAKESKKNYIKKVFNVGKKIATAEYATGVKSLKATLAAGAGEGFEEVSEEVLADFSKGCFNVVKWLQGDDTRLTTFGYDPKTGEWNSTDVLDRYGMSLIGGFAGGATTNAFTSYKTIKNLDKMTSKEAVQEIVKMARNHELDGFRKDIIKMKNLGDRTKSATDYEITDNGVVLFMPGTKENNQEVYNKQAIIGFTNLIQNTLDANGAKSDSELLDALTLREMRFTALHDSLTASSYIDEYNTLSTKLIEIISDINSKQNLQKDTNNDGVVTDREERRARDNKIPNPNQAEIDKLYKDLNETKKKLDDLINGKRSIDFLKESLFEATAVLSSHFTFPTYILYAEHKFKKKYSELTETQRKEAADEYAKWASTEKVDQIRTLAHIYYDIAKSASDAIKQSGEKYQQDPRAIYSFNDRVAQLFETVIGKDKQIHYLPNEVQNDNYIELAQRAVTNSYLRSMINGLQALGKTQEIEDVLKLQKDKFQEKLDAANKQLTDLDEQYAGIIQPLQKIYNDTKSEFEQELNSITDPVEKNTRAQEQIEELKALRKKIEDNQSDHMQKRAEKKAELEDFLRNVAPKQVATETSYDTIMKLKDGIKELVSNYVERGFINEEARSQLINALQYYRIEIGKLFESGILSEDQYMAINSELEPLKKQLDQLANTAIESELNNFSITINQEELNYTQLLQKLNKLLKNSATDVSQFMANGLLEELKNAIFIAQMYRAAIVGASTDNASLSNIFGYNTTINDVLKAQGETPVLAEIDSRTANLIITDIDGVLNKLIYFKNLIDFNNGQSLNAQDQAGLKFAQLVHKKLRYIINIPNDDPLTKWVGFDELKAAVESATLFETSEKQEWTKVPSDQKKEFEQQKINVENAIYNFFQKNKEKLSDPSKLAELINGRHFTIYSPVNTIITRNSQELDDNAFIWWLASRAALKSEDFHTEFAEILNENEEKIIAPLSIQEATIYNCYAMILNGNVFKQFAAAFNYSIENEFKDKTFDGQIGEAISRIDDVQKRLEAFRTYFDASYVKYTNIVLNEGIPGSGKSTGVSKLIIRMLRKYHRNLLKNVWVTHCVSEEKAKGFRDSLGLNERESKVFSRESLLQKLSPDWKPYTLNSYGREIIPESVYSYNEGYIRSKLAISETSEPPSLIVIDEVTRMNRFDLDLIQQFAQKYGITVIVMGDYDQISTDISYKIPSEAQEITILNPESQTREKMERATDRGSNHTFIRSPKLGISMRTDNLLITENNYQLIKYVQEETGDINLKYYEDETGLYGHKAINSTNVDEIKEEIRKLIPTLKEGEKIGFIYSSSNTVIYDALNADPSLKEHIEFLKDGSSQGSESQYYLIDGTALDEIRDKKLIYTGLTRAQQGCLLVWLPIESRFRFTKVREKLYYPNTQQALKKYLTTRKSILQEVCHGNPTQYTETTKEIQQKNPQNDLRQEFLQKLNNVHTYRDLQDLLNNEDYASFVNELNKEDIILKTIDVIIEDDSLDREEFTRIYKELLSDYITEDYLTDTSTYNPYTPLFDKNSHFEGDAPIQVKLVKELLGRKRIHQNYAVDSNGAITILYRVTPKMYVPFRYALGKWKPLIGFDENVAPVEFINPPTVIQAITNWLNTNLNDFSEGVILNTLTADSETNLNTLVHEQPAIQDEDSKDIFVANVKGSIQTLNACLSEVKVHTSSLETFYKDDYIDEDIPLFNTANNIAFRTDFSVGQTDEDNNQVTIINSRILINSKNREFVRNAIKKFVDGDVIYDDEIADYFTGNFKLDDDYITDDIFIELANLGLPTDLYTDDLIKDWCNKHNKTKLPIGEFGLHINNEWLKDSISITMPLYSFNTFELGAQRGPNDTIIPSSFAEKRIDSINGLLRIDKLYPDNLKLAPSMSEAINVIALLRDAIFNISNKQDLLRQISTILGIDNLYGTFAFKSSAWNKETRGVQSTEPNAFEKDNEQSIYNGGTGFRSGSINHKSLVFIIGNEEHGNLLELPLLTLSNPFSLLEQAAKESNETGVTNVWQEIYDEFIQLKRRYADFNQYNPNSTGVREIITELISKFDGVQKYKCMVNLLKLWLFTDNGIFHIIDPNWTIANNLTLRGQQFITDVSSEYLTDGYELDFDKDNWITLEEFSQNKERFMTPILVSYTGNIDEDPNCPVSKGHPFVLVSQDSRISTAEQIIEQYKKQLTDPNSTRPVVSIMYVLPPKATISEYIKNLDRIFRKKKHDVWQLGDLTTTYRIMDKIIDDNELSNILQTRIGNETFDRLIEVISNLRRITDKQELIQELLKPSNVRTGKEENIIHMLNGMLMRIAMDNNLLNNNKTFNEDNIQKISNLMESNGIDGIFYNVKPDSENNIMGLKIFSTNDRYQLNEKPFRINGKLDSYTFMGNLDVFINQLIRNIAVSQDGVHQYIKGSNLYYDFNTNQIGNSNINNIRRNNQPNINSIDQSIADNIKRKLENFGDSELINIFNNIFYADGNLIKKSMLNTAKSNLVDSLNRKGYVALFDSNNDLFIGKFADESIKVRRGSNRPINIIANNTGKNNITVQIGDEIYQAEIDINSKTLTYTKQENPTPPVQLQESDVTAFTNSKTIFDEKVGYDEDLMKIFEATSLSDLIQKLDELIPAIDIEDSSKSIRIQDLLTEFRDGSVDEKRVLDIITKYEEYNMNKTSQCPRQITINL